MKNRRITALMVALLVVINAQAAQPINFVFMIADDISHDDLGCYGNKVIKTPNMDRLAANGLRFDQSYLTTSSCSPSRCSIITGRYPHNTGAAELHTTLPEGQVLFPELLKDAGYFTVLSGKHHMGPVANAAFTKVSSGKGPGKEGDWVEILKQRPKDQPFFCWFASTDAHHAWVINDEAPIYDPDDMIVPPYLVDGPKTRQDLADYAHEVSRFDHFVGLVSDELKRQSVFDNTVMIVMADNGRPFPRCKTRLYDSGIKTPFIVHHPKRVRPAVTSSLISAIDISATVLDLAGIEKDERIQGVSFAPILADPNATVRNVVFAEHNWHVYRNHERLVRTGDWLYIRNNMPNQQNLCVEAYHCGTGEELWASHAAGTLTQAQMNVFQNPCPEEELYRVSDDAEQLSNLIGMSEHEGVAEDMRAILSAWTDATGDSVPKNPTPSRDAPPGQPKLDRKKFKYGEMPGALYGAEKLNATGPI